MNRFLKISFFFILGCVIQTVNISASENFLNRLGDDSRSAAKRTWEDFRYVYSSPLRINRSSALRLAGVLAVGGVVFRYDQEIYDAFKRNEYNKYYKPIRDMGEFFEPLGFMGFTNKYLFGTLAFGYIFDIEPMVAISADVLEYFLVGSLGKTMIMVSTGRKGPSIRKGPRRFKFADGRSFPSGHTIAITQLAGVLSYHIDYLPFKIFIYSVATSVLLQRITSDSHWPSDVYAGAFYGFTLTHGLLKLKKNRSIKAAPVIAPEEGLLGFYLSYCF